LKNSFKKAERLKSSIEIGSLLSEGHLLNSFPLKIFWKISPSPLGTFPAKVAFVVSKRKFKRAVDRNLIKRRLRESYRINKHLLYKLLTDNNIGLKFVIIYLPNEIYSYDKISKGMQGSLSGLVRKVNAEI
jgi:ribonuclease P protein component